MLVFVRFFLGVHGANTWEFGQIFPLLLLMVPIISVVETYNGEFILKHQIQIKILYYGVLNHTLLVLPRPALGDFRTAEDRILITLTRSRKGYL